MDLTTDPHERPAPEPAERISTERSWRRNLAFGIHYDFHAEPTDGDIGRGLASDDLVEMWREVGPDWVQCDTKGHVGYASYPSRIGPRPEVLPGDPLRLYRDATNRLGLPLVSHYCSLLDKNAGSRPEWSRVDDTGRATGQACCVNSRYRDELVIPQLLEVVDDYDIDGVWIDGDTWAVSPCYCERCQALYKEATGEGTIPRSERDPGWSTWLAFHRQCHERHVAAIADAVHRRKPGCLVTFNWAYSLLQPDELKLPVDTLSGDLAHVHTLDWQECEVRFLDRRGLPWDLQQWTFTRWGSGQDYEMRSVEHLCQAGAMTLASGGAACFYVVPLRTGKPVRWQNEVMREVAAFCRHRAPHCIGTESIPQVAVLHSAASHYAASESFGATPEVGLYTSFEKTANIKGAILGMLDLHCHVDVVTDRMLQERGRAYGLVVVPEPRALPDSTRSALTDYVEAGGRLLLTGCEVTDFLPHLTGLRGGAGEVAGVRWVDVGGRTTGLPGPWREADPVSAEAVLYQLHNQEIESAESAGPRFPAVSLNYVGQGRVVTVPGPLFSSFYSNRLQWRRQVLRLACEALSPDLDVELTGPSSVHLTYRRRGHTRMINLLNTGASPSLGQRKHDVEQVPETGPLTLRVRLESEPSAVRLEPDGRCSWDWNGGFLEVAVPSLHIHSIVVID